MNFEEILHLRQSVRQYTEKPVKQDDLNFLLLSGQAAPIGKHNFQGYALTVLTDPTILKRIKEEFQHVTGRESDPVFGAPAVFIIFETPDTIQELKGFDAGCIAENIQLAAFSRGLGAVCIFSFIRSLGVHPGYLEGVGIPQGYLPLLSVAVGYPAHYPSQRSLQERIACLSLYRHTDAADGTAHRQDL